LAATISWSGRLHFAVSDQRPYLSRNRFSEGDATAPEGSAIGDKINNFTGGRMGWLIDGARKAQDDKHTGVDQTPKMHGSESNGTNGHSHSNGHANEESVRKPAKLATKQAETAKTSSTEQPDGPQKRVTKSIGGSTDSAGTTKGAANGTTAT
jgi:hypothetical protein